MYLKFNEIPNVTVRVTWYILYLDANLNYNGNMILNTIHEHENPECSTTWTYKPQCKSRHIQLFHIIGIIIIVSWQNTIQHYGNMKFYSMPNTLQQSMFTTAWTRILRSSTKQCDRNYMSGYLFHHPDTYLISNNWQPVQESI